MKRSYWILPPQPFAYETRAFTWEDSNFPKGTLIKVEEVEEDPTPWCAACGAKECKYCNCGPIAEND